MKKTILAVVILLILAIGLWTLSPRTLPVQTAFVKKGLFQDILQTDGKTRSQNREIVSAFASGDITKIQLRVGDRVKKGQKIAVLKWDRDQEILAPMDGVVSRLYRESAGPVNRAEPLIEISNTEELEIVIEILTTEAAKIKLGQKVTVEGWGGEAFSVPVSKISQAGFVKTSALGIEEERTEVLADLRSLQKEVLEKLGDNFHVRCLILINEYPESLLVPIGALFKVGENWTVYKIENKRAKEVQVEVAEKGLNEFRLLSGLKEGDEVILYPDQISPGDRVQ